jgi:hypothetical protein
MKLKETATNRTESLLSQYLLIAHWILVETQVDDDLALRSVDRPGGLEVEHWELGIPRVAVLLVHAPPQLRPFVHHRLPPASMVADSVADPDPGSGAFLTPGSGIRDRFFRIPDLGSRNPNSYF